MKVRAVWQFFEAERDGNSIHLFAPGAPSPLHTFHFGRQPASDGLCLSDYILDADDGRPRSPRVVRRDRGRGHPRAFRGSQSRPASSSRRTRCRRWPSKPRKAAPNGCIAASAKTGASPIRRRIDHAGALHVALSRQALQLRLSGLPESGRSAGIVELLKPEEIGVQLTEGMMMDPEASVSALVFHHPDCAYFSVAS